MDVDKFLRRNEELLNKVDGYIRSAESKNNKNRLLLCMSQIQKILKLLFDATLLKEQNIFALKEIFKYLGKRLEWCVEECDKVLTKKSNTNEDDNENYYGRFVQLVDRALLLIADGLHCTDSETRNWKPVFEDIICQSLTIAGMAGGIDSDEITASCHKILSECNRLEEECKGQVAALQSSFLADCILQLERRVSTALLGLVLKTFSDYTEPLKRLILVIDCENCGVRSPSDLDDIVDNFDSHSDCIQHIAVFALACSEYSKDVLKIRCCLASLESLDDSLVPAAVALYMDPKHSGKRLLLKFLATVWLDEVKSLEQHLDCIIDSTAYAAVTLESIKGIFLGEVITENNRNTQPLILSVLQAARFDRHRKTSLPEMIPSPNPSAVIRECKIAMYAWLENLEDREGRPVDLRRVMSRFHLLLYTIENISNKLSADLAKKNDNYENTSALLEDVSFPDSKSASPIDSSSITASSRSRKIGGDPSIIASIKSEKIGGTDSIEMICFSKFDKPKAVKNPEIPKPEYILLDPYKVKATEKCMLTNTLYAPSPRRVKLTPIAAIPKSRDLQFHQTLGLDLTIILERFTDISQATLSTIDCSSRPEESPIEMEGDKQFSPNLTEHCAVEIEQNKSFFPDLSGICLLENNFSKLTINSEVLGEGSDGSSVNTLDRFNDLKKVEERIDQLREMANL